MKAEAEPICGHENDRTGGILPKVKKITARLPGDVE